MTSREIIRRVIGFDSPPRIGLWLPQPYGSDFVVGGMSAGESGAGVPLEPVGNELRRWRDEWGVVWHSLTDYDKGEVAEGAIADWSELDDYRPPDLGDGRRYQRAAALFASETEKFRVGGIPGFVFNVARKIRKLDTYLCDLLLARAEVDRLNGLVREQLLACIDRMADAGADGVIFPEDWGTQDRLMIDPALWRELFKPDFATLCAAAHDRGLAVFMHCCGKVTDIIGDLIEVGVDVVEFHQPRLHGLDALAGFAGRLTYICPVDIQTTLQTRDPALIVAEAEELATKLGRGGGFIAGYYGGNEAIGLTPDIQDHACRRFAELAGRAGG